MSKHTPGPWEIGGVTADGQTITIHGSRFVIADVHNGVALVDVISGYKHGVQMANAKLIAAAPELLAVLQEFVANSYEQDAGGGDYVVTTCEARERAIEAIAKAIGN